MNGVHTETQVDELKTKVERIEKTLKLLIVWLTNELGERSKDALLAELKQEQGE